MNPFYVIFGIYVVFTWRFAWEMFLKAEDGQRVAFGALVFTWSLVYWWYA